MFCTCTGTLKTLHYVYVYITNIRKCNVYVGMLDQKIEVAYLSTKFILMDREKNIKLNGKKITVIEFTVQKLQIFEYLIFGVFPEIIQ